MWLSGPPGAGKSTSAQMLGRDHGYVYYEGDCFGMMKNPFIDLNAENPTMHQMKQKNLKGKTNCFCPEGFKNIFVGNGAAERGEFLKKSQEVFAPLMAGLEYDKSVIVEFYKMMCQDILDQKKRIGGTWAIAAVPFIREIRDVMR